MPTPVVDALAAAAEALDAAGVEDPRLDAEVLLCEAAGLDRAALAAGPGRELGPAPGRRFAEMVRRRLRREPVAYIVGRKGFRRLELRVDPRVLVPRPETELLVEVALELRPARALDVGTGSGAIALAVADELPGCEVTATDTSRAALEVARANAERLGLTGRVRFLEGTLPGAPTAGEGPASAAARRLPGREDPATDAFELVLANLPYVSEADWPTLQPEVRDWEPREALLAGPDGLDAMRSLIPTLAGAPLHHTEGQGATAGVGGSAAAVARAPVVALEVGEGQAGAVREMLRGAGFAATEARRDLAGVERVVVGRR